MREGNDEDRNGDGRPLHAGDVAVGDTGPELVVSDLERRDFVRYAGASGDFNPIHYDEPYATEAGNPSVFGQGMLTAGFAATQVTDWFGLDRVRAFETRFRSRVFPGDTVRATGEVVGIETTGEGTDVVEVDVAVRREDGEAVVTGSATVRLPPRQEETAER